MPLASIRPAAFLRHWRVLPSRGSQAALISPWIGTIGLLY
jgi:hypothetical protein